MSDPAKPFFRFYPGVYESPDMAIGGRCDICGCTDCWIYQGSIYTLRSGGRACAPCIADDKLAAFLDDPDFQLHDISTEDMEPELEREVMQRTPGFACFNPFFWPSIDGVPLAFAGYGDNQALWGDAGARAAMEQAWREASGRELSEPSAYLLVFRQLAGGEWRAEVDLD